MKMFFDMLRNERGEVGGKKKADDDSKKNDEGLELDLEDDLEDTDGSLEIDLDEGKKNEDEDEGAAPASNKAWAEMRVENKELKKTLAEMKEQISSLQPQNTYVPPVRQSRDMADPMNWTEEQWDTLAKENWKKAVDLRAEIQARKIHETATVNSEFNRAQEEAKQRVLERHPELNDINSEKAKIYKNIVTANPEYIHQKKGPLTAMYEMEEYMEKNMGYKREDIVKAETRGRQQEQERLNRVAISSTTGRNVSQGNKVILTKEDREFCEIQGIDPKTFAANKKQLEKSGRGGIQL